MSSDQHNEQQQQQQQQQCPTSALATASAAVAAAAARGEVRLPASSPQQPPVARPIFDVNDGQVGDTSSDMGPAKWADWACTPASMRKFDPSAIHWLTSKRELTLWSIGCPAVAEVTRPRAELQKAMRGSMSGEQAPEGIGSSSCEKAAKQEGMGDMGSIEQGIGPAAYHGGPQLPIDDDDDDDDKEEAAASPWPKSISEHGESVRNSIEEFQAEWVQGSSQQDRVAARTGKDYEGDVDEEERERPKKRVRRDVEGGGVDDDGS